MRNLIFGKNPSRFGRGISLLWRGNNLSFFHEFIYRLFHKKKNLKDPECPGIFLFETARSAIFNCLIANGIGCNDEVIVSCFTCDAVTDAVARSGAKIVFVDINDDLTMSDSDVISAINPSTKAIIMQDTFGRLGLKEETIKIIRDNEIFLLEDYVLSVGSSKGDKKIGAYGDVAFWSLEVSKTITIGWGGVLIVNDEKYLDTIKARYSRIKKISILSDLRRIIQVWTSLTLTKYNLPFGYILWLFLYGARIFKKSSVKKERNALDDKLGSISENFFYYLQPSFESFFKKTNDNYNIFYERADNLRLNIPIKPDDDEYIVSPRFSILVSSEKIDAIKEEAIGRGIEIGTWFNFCPPISDKMTFRIFSQKNSKDISNTIINFPCHWTLSSHEIDEILNLIELTAKYSHSEV